LVSTDGADSGEVLESGEDVLDDGGFSWDAGLEGQSGDVLGVFGETLKDGALVQGHKLGADDGTVVVHGQDGHTILEWLVAEFLEESSLGGGDLLALGANLDVTENFDLGLLDLGWDLEGVEEVDLGGVETSWASWDDEVNWGEFADTSVGETLLGLNLWKEFGDWFLSEDESDLADDQGLESLELWHWFPGGSAGVFLWGSSNSHLDGFVEDGVFADDEFTLSLTDDHTDILDLGG